MSEWRNYIRPTDLGWVLLFSFLALFGPERSMPMELALFGLAAFQLIEPRIHTFTGGQGQYAAILIKLVLCLILIGYTGRDALGDWSKAFNSPYYVILLLPVVAAATTLGWVGTTLFLGLTCLGYFSFYWILDKEAIFIPADEWPHVWLRIIMFPLIGFLTYHLAEENRKKARDAEAAAAQLAEANQSLQAAEDAVRRADRLAALGQLTAGLAHELRNPLATIKSSSEILQNSLPKENDVAAELAGFISSEVDRTNSLISRFLDFARPLKVRLESGDITEVIDRAVANLDRHMPPYPVTIHRNYSPDVHLLKIDAELMERVLYNLLQNAAQASPAGAPITIKTRAAGSMIEIAIIDRGSGIDAKNLTNIFNPFFTTKKEGVGLGLPIVAKIVDEHGGKITVDSVPKEGSVFHILLPVEA